VLPSIQPTLHHKRELRRFNDLSAEQRDIVFYSETAAYWTYFGPFVGQLTRAQGRKVCYVTSPDDDPILLNSPDGVDVFAISDGGDPYNIFRYPRSLFDVYEPSGS